MADDATRRDFLDLAIKGGIVLGGAGMAVPAALYLLPAGSRGPKDALVSAGPVAGFAPGTARLVQGEGRPILVLALAPDRFRAFSAICTHLGCIVKWDAPSGTIQCPCHAATFGSDGRVLAGPPPRPLLELEVVRSGDELKVKL
jgi:cytochrome b6-f complex iron-sulfur subunit